MFVFFLLGGGRGGGGILLQQKSPLRAGQLALRNARILTQNATGQLLAAMKRIKVTVMNMAVMPLTLGVYLMLVLHAQGLFNN